MDYKIVEVKEDIIRRNDSTAEELRKQLKEKKIFFINLMASPGSGKTTLLLHLLPLLKEKYRIAVMEADIDSEVDAVTISKELNIPTLQIHTSGACHLTAQMVEDALKDFDLSNIDLLILENIGNLVCPAEFDTGANMNLVLLSVPEGDDKPLKYPLMFEVASMVVATKFDTREVFDFDVEKFHANVRKRNKIAEIFETSAINDIGIAQLANKLIQIIDSYSNV